MPSSEVVEDLTALRQVARLADALAHPFRTFDAASCQVGSLSPSEIASLARLPDLRRSLERAFLDAHGLRALPLGADEIAALARTPDGRLALLLLTEAADRLPAVALLLVSAALQRHVLHVTHKSERHRCRDILGVEGHLVATGEAPTQHPGLALDGARFVLEEAMADHSSLEASRQRLIDLGLCLLQFFVAHHSPALGSVMTLRLPMSARRPELRAIAVRLDAVYFERVTRFIRRRMPVWAAIIG